MVRGEKLMLKKTAFLLSVFILISIFLSFNLCSAQIPLYPQCFWTPTPFSLFLLSPGFTMNYHPLYSPETFLRAPFHFSPLQPSPPLLLMPKIIGPRLFPRVAAATITIFVNPSQSAISVTTLPVAPIPTTSIPSAVSASSSLGFIAPALLTIANNPYVQTQTQTLALTTIFSLAPLVGAPTAVIPSLAGLVPFI